jgi:hypothetical protein
MKQIMSLAGAALLATTLLSSPAGAQGKPETVSLVTVDVHQLATGYRSSKIVGSAVVNDANQTIGKVDDLIISQDGKAPFVVLSVGGFLGIDSRYVVLPTTSLTFAAGKIVLSGGTKAALQALPEFKYGN